MKVVINLLIYQNQRQKKFRILARYLEELIIKSSLSDIENILRSKNKEYIRFIGGIGNSRILQFCVSKEKDEESTKEDIQFILNKMKTFKQRVKREEVNHMLNNAIIHEKYDVVDFIFSNEELERKIHLEDCDYMIIKNLLIDDKHNSLFKIMIIEKKFKLDIKIEEMIKKSQNEDMKNFLIKYHNYEKINNNLVPLKKELRVKI